MSNSHLKSLTTLPSLEVLEKKAARKKLLEEVRKRRYQIAAKRRMKEQNAYSTNEDYREYQDTL